MSHGKDKPFREQYAQIASHADPRLLGRAKDLGYSEAQIENVPGGAVETGLGCGNPTALAELREGQTVLDLGSGAGLDVFVAAQKVGPRGKIVGVDATPEMVHQAQQYAREGRYENVEFKVGRIEDLPLADRSVDVIISNCVINHSSDKPAAFKEALRVLRPDGKIHIADLVVEGPLPATDSPGLEVWASWLAVASGKQEYVSAMQAAGFREITIVTECRYDGPAMTPLLAGKIVSLLIQARAPTEAEAPSAKSQISNRSQTPGAKGPNAGTVRGLGLEFGILIIDSCLEFGAWCLVLPMHLFSMLVCLLFLLAPGMTIGSEPSKTAGTIKAAVSVERVFGPEHPGGRYKHPASIAQLANGDLYLAYYTGSGEYATDTAVYGARLAKGQTRWTTPIPIADTPFRSEGNPVVWQSPDGPVWLFYVIRYGQTWSTSLIQVKISRDGARTWSDPMLVTRTQGMMVRSRPLALVNSDILLPVYHETGQDTEMVGPDSCSLFFRWDARLHTWTETNRIRSRIGNIQPAVAPITDDHLVCYCRRGGDYSGRPDGRIVRAESHDGGRTWSEGKETEFRNPNAAVEFLRLQSGHHLLIFNDSVADRTPLTAALSTDGDKTYPYRRNLIEGPGDYAYPYTIQARDGKIHLVFTSDERTTIYHAVFEEADVLGRESRAP